MRVCSMFYRFGIHICDLKTRSTIDFSPSARTRRAASGLVRFPAPLVRTDSAPACSPSSLVRPPSPPQLILARERSQRPESLLHLEASLRPPRSSPVSRPNAVSAPHLRQSGFRPRHRRAETPRRNQLNASVRHLAGPRGGTNPLARASSSSPLATPDTEGRRRASPIGADDCRRSSTRHGVQGRSATSQKPRRVREGFGVHTTPRTPFRRDADCPHRRLRRVNRAVSASAACPSPTVPHGSTPATNLPRPRRPRGRRRDVTRRRHRQAARSATRAPPSATIRAPRRRCGVSRENRRPTRQRVASRAARRHIDANSVSARAARVSAIARSFASLADDRSRCSPRVRFIAANQHSRPDSKMWSRSRRRRSRATSGGFARVAGAKIPHAPRARHRAKAFAKVRGDGGTGAGRDGDGQCGGTGGVLPSSPAPG